MYVYMCVCVYLNTGIKEEEERKRRERKESFTVCSSVRSRQLGAEGGKWCNHIGEQRRGGKETELKPINK